MWGRFRQLSFDNPLAAAAVQHPGYARAGLLLLAALVTFLVLTLFKTPLSTFEEQAGAIAWRLNPDTEAEERINIIAIIASINDIDHAKITSKITS